MDVTEDNYPVFLFGVHGLLMGITKMGDAYFKQEVYANALSLSSDFRLKDNIRPVSYPLTLTDSLQPVSYYLKSDKRKQQRLGFIAQEVQRHFPCLVREGGKGMLKLDYIGLIPVLWDFSRQLRQENVELKKEAAEQAARIDKLEAEIKAIKELLNQDK
ncbi:MAG: tail fiber domain-containing protein [Bacteroidales bacterium]|nr:tail fiber domain-containing protein [Bacteroidales bacterium]